MLKCGDFEIFNKIFMIKSDAQNKLAMVRARYQNDLSVLLRPYYSFRLFIKFKKAHFDGKGHKKDTKHFYGIENTCSYNQCLHGHVDNIFLDKKMGYNNCIYLAEQKYMGQYFLAQIYTRLQFPDGKFDILLREYSHNGELLADPQDPVFKPEDNRTLFFLLKNDYLVLTEDPVPSAEDVKALIDETL
jgi:hypothetical protein